MSGEYAGYMGYRFRYNRSGFYSAASMCYENQYFVFDCEDMYGVTRQIEVSWNKSAETGDIIVRPGRITKGGDGTDTVILWAVKAEDNGTGYSGWFPPYKTAAWE